MTDNDNKLIQRFFSFDLDDNELQQVEQRMENDPAFKKQMKLYTLVDAKVDEQFDPASAAQKKDFTDNWKNLQEDDEKTIPDLKQNDQPGAKIFSFRMLAAAASILLMLGLAFWIFTSKNNSPEGLAMQYWEATSEQQFALQRSGDDDAYEIQLTKAANFYNQKQFQKSLDLLNGIPDDFVHYDKILLYKGQCYFQLDDNNKAISNFQQLLDNPASSQQDLALWFQALAFLKQKDITKAKANLEIIVREKYPVAKQAKLLLGAL